MIPFFSWRSLLCLFLSAFLEKSINKKNRPSGGAAGRKRYQASSFALLFILKTTMTMPMDGHNPKPNHGDFIHPLSLPHIMEHGLIRSAKRGKRLKRKKRKKKNRELEKRIERTPGTVGLKINLS
jgi:hypothetical protein